MDAMIDTGKILFEGMDLSGKSTISKDVSLILNIEQIKQRTLSDQTAIYDFTVAQSKLGNLSQELISKLYCLAVNEDLANYKVSKKGIILQDSYFALRSFALAQQNNDVLLARDLYDLLKLFPKPELSFYLTAPIEERIRRNLQRNKPMAYMEKLLMLDPKKFENIEKHLKKSAIEIFNAEVIDTSIASHDEVSKYIGEKVKSLKIYKENGDEKVY